MSKFLPELVFIFLIAIYSIVITKIIPKKLYSFSNLIIAFGAILYGVFFGTSLQQLGIGFNLILVNMLIGLALSMPIIISIILFSSYPTFSKHFSRQPNQNYNWHQFAYELGFRIPFGTALSEEVIFRSVLFAILLSNHSVILAIIFDSIIFGLWHVFPTLHAVKDHESLNNKLKNKHQRNMLAVFVSIITTSILGVGLALLTLKTKSFISAWVLHSAINGSAVFGGYFTIWRTRRQAKV